MIGQTLGHYRIESKLGEGGMGVVYKARDLHLDRLVAIKVLLLEAVANPERKRRFVQEAKAASALNHPNIVHVYDIDTTGPEGRPVDFIAMEYIEGRTLDELTGRKELPVREALKYAVQMADALAAAHGSGIARSQCSRTRPCAVALRRDADKRAQRSAKIRALGGSE